MNLKRNAFTLVELLVVIGIIGLLSGILLPSLCKAKARARVAVCKSNLHQISLALTMYVGEFQRYPDKGSWMTTALRWNTNQKLLPYTADSRNVFYCPAHAARWATWESAMDLRNFDRLSYGYNSFGSSAWVWQNLGLGATRARPIAEAQVRAPSDMIALGDAGTDKLWDLLLNPHEEPPPASSEDQTTINSWLPANRHSGGANVVFCDGHVEYAAQKRWIEKTDPARRRWNHDHEPHRETW